MIDRYILGAAGPVHNVQQINHCKTLWKQMLTKPLAAGRQSH